MKVHPLNPNPGRGGVNTNLSRVVQAAPEPLKARNGTIIKPGFFIKVPSDLPLSSGWSRVSPISLSDVTNPARDQYTLNNPLIK